MCPGRRDGPCDAPAVRVSPIDGFVIDHFAKHSMPPEAVAAMREALRLMRHVPDEGLRAQRQRIETATTRLGDRDVWQEIGEAEYGAQRRRLKAQLAELPLPSDSNLLAFDRAAATLLPFANIIRGTTREHQRAILMHIVERVVIRDREVFGITVRPEARPFSSDYPAAVVMAPPDGREGPRSKPLDDPLAWYAGPGPTDDGSLRGSGVA